MLIFFVKSFSRNFFVKLPKKCIFTFIWDKKYFISIFTYYTWFAPNKVICYYLFIILRKSMLLCNDGDIWRNNRGNNLEKKSNQSFKKIWWADNWLPIWFANNKIASNDIRTGTFCQHTFLWKILLWKLVYQITLFSITYESGLKY